MKPCVLLLTCTDEFEADTITQSLLKKKLIVCAKKIKTSSQFLYRKHIHTADEELLVMDSFEENFSKIESVVRQIHSYNTFVLLQLPVSKTTDKVTKWIQSELIL